MLPAHASAAGVATVYCKYREERRFPRACTTNDAIHAKHTRVRWTLRCVSEHNALEDGKVDNDASVNELEDR